jgi:hypothetical protein
MEAKKAEKAATMDANDVEEAEDEEGGNDEKGGLKEKWMEADVHYQHKLDTQGFLFFISFN